MKYFSLLLLATIVSFISRAKNDTLNQHSQTSDVDTVEIYSNAMHNSFKAVVIKQLPD